MGSQSTCYKNFIYIFCSYGALEQPYVARAADANRDFEAPAGPDAQGRPGGAKPHPRLHFIFPPPIQKARIQKFSGTKYFGFYHEL